MRTPRYRTPPHNPTRRHAIGVGSVFSALPIIINAAVTAYPYFADKPVLAWTVSGLLAAVFIAAGLRWGYAVWVGSDDPPSYPARPSASPTEPEHDDEDVSEVRAVR